MAVQAFSGMEKFNHLEDKLYRIVEQIKVLTQGKENIERDLAVARNEIVFLKDENERLKKRLEQMMSERDAIKLKIEAMLDAIAMVDPEIVSLVNKA